MKTLREECRLANIPLSAYGVQLMPGADPIKINTVDDVRREVRYGGTIRHAIMDIWENNGHTDDLFRNIGICFDMDKDDRIQTIGRLVEKWFNLSAAEYLAGDMDNSDELRKAHDKAEAAGENMANYEIAP